MSGGAARELFQEGQVEDCNVVDFCGGHPGRGQGEIKAVCGLLLLVSYSLLNSFSVSVIESAWMSLLVEKSVDFSTDHPLLAV